MIIMALDHTRDFFHSGAFTGDPLDLKTTTPLLFVTRWITHFCAPVFVFLSGISAYLQRPRKTRSALSRFLITRGIWLIAAELLIITFGITFSLGYHLLILQVIWAIGISMVLLGLLIWLPFPAILALGMAIVFGHNLLDGWEAGHKSGFPFWYDLLHRSAVHPITPDRSLMIVYPFLPWTGLMVLGYCAGRIFSLTAAERKKYLMLAGVIVTALFLVLRGWNIYGDPVPWTAQSSFLDSVFAFVDTRKYPPSLLYLCMTIGPSLIVLSLLEGVRNRLSEGVSVYGRVPFFYYILHFYLIHAVSATFYFLRGHSYSEGAESVPFRFISAGEGYGLGVVYLVWVFIVLSLFPLCKWYSRYKLEKKRWWTSYL